MITKITKWILHTLDGIILPICCVVFTCLIILHWNYVFEKDLFHTNPIPIKELLVLVGMSIVVLLLWWCNYLLHEELNKKR